MSRFILFGEIILLFLNSASFYYSDKNYFNNYNIYIIHRNFTLFNVFYGVTNLIINCFNLESYCDITNQYEYTYNNNPYLKFLYYLSNRYLKVVFLTYLAMYGYIMSYHIDNVINIPNIIIVYLTCSYILTGLLFIAVLCAYILIFTYIAIMLGIFYIKNKINNYLLNYYRLNNINNIRKTSEPPIDDVCSICHSVEEFKKWYHLDCDHKFHIPCLTPWLKLENNTCPLCKKIIIN